jgi:hypothetical protein
MFYTSAEVVPADDPVARRIGKVADSLFQYSRKDFNLRVGEREIRYTDRPQFVVVVQSPKVLRRLLIRANAYQAADAFVDGEWDIEGDLLAGLRTKNTLYQRAESLRLRDKLKLFFQLLRI